MQDVPALFSTKNIAPKYTHITVQITELRHTHINKLWYTVFSTFYGNYLLPSQLLQKPRSPELFSYSQQSKCADLLDSYVLCTNERRIP